MNAHPPAQNIAPAFLHGLPGRLLAAVLLVLLVAAAYLPAVRGGYIWDDDNYLTRNSNLQSVEGLKRTWLEPRANPQYYPLVFSSFWIERRLWGVNPLGYHLVNVMLHGLNAVLVWLLLRNLSVPGAWLAAAIFALHPVHVESVAWITERKNVLSGTGYLGSLLAYLRFLSCRPGREAARRRRVLYGLSLALFIAALLSKTVTSTLPAAVLLILWWKRGRVGWRDVFPLVPMFAAGAILGMHTAYLERTHVGAMGPEWDFSLPERVLIAFRALWFYAAKLVWPHPLIFIYPRWEIDATRWSQYLFVLAGGAAVVSLWLLRHRIGRGPLAAALFFGGTLFPALGFFDIYPMRFSFVADHFQYLASLGPIVLVAASGAYAAGRLRKPGRTILGAAAALLLVCLGLLSWRQGTHYSGVESIWRDTIKKNPGSFLAHTNLGALLQGEGNLEEARQHYEQALRFKPDYSLAHANLGVLYEWRGDFGRARLHYELALRFEPDMAEAHYNLGFLSEKEGDLERAEAEYREAVTLKPDYGDAHNNLGALYARQGDLERAMHHYEEALRINPRLATAHFNLGFLHMSTRNISRARHHFEQALIINPDFDGARAALESIRSAGGGGNQ